MKNELIVLKEKLDVLLIEESINSKEVLCLSREIDKMIVEYYRNQMSYQ